MDSEIVERDGRLFVLDAWEQGYNEPVYTRIAWPTGILAHEYPHFIGESCTYFDSGLYRLRSGQMIALEYRGQTKPAWKESKPVRKPRNKTTYRHGEWF